MQIFSAILIKNLLNACACEKKIVSLHAVLVFCEKPGTKTEL